MQSTRVVFLDWCKTGLSILGAGQAFEIYESKYLPPQILAGYCSVSTAVYSFVSHITVTHVGGFL